MAAGAANNELSGHLRPRISEWVLEVVPRVGLSSFVVATVLIDNMSRMAVDTSQGRLPVLTLAHRQGIYQISIAKQTTFMFMWAYSIRELKFFFDYLQSPKMLSTMCASGLVGIPLSSLQYNSALQDTYRYFAIPPPSFGGVKSYLRLKVAPGLLWAYIRGAGSTGGGLCLSDPATACIRAQFVGSKSSSKDKASSFAGSFVSGVICCVASQWAHNASLIAGRMAALGEKQGAPYYTAASLWSARREMGFSVFYLGLAARLPITTSTVVSLHVCDLFYRPELSFFG